MGKQTEFSKTKNEQKRRSVTEFRDEAVLEHRHLAYSSRTKHHSSDREHQPKQRMLLN